MTLCKPRSSALRKLLELSLPIVEAAQTRSEHSLGVRFDSLAPHDAIKSADLIFISFHNFLHIDNRKGVLKKSYLAFIVLGCICRH